jgi:hypothetical protein
MRNVVDLCLTYTASDELTLGLNADYGHEQNVPGAGDADWFGAAGYAGFKLSDRFTLNGRAEWFNDEDGSRGFGTTVYEITLGVAVTPFPNDRWGKHLKLRPELRYDRAADDVFDGASADDQVTAAIDAIFTY